MKLSIRLKQAKRISKRIDKYKIRKQQFQSYVDRVQECIDRDEKELKKLCASMSKEEFLELGRFNGDIPDADYMIIKHKMESKK